MLKAAEILIPILAPSTFSEHLKTKIDASNAHIGVVLMQDSHSLACFNLRLTLRMSESSAYIKELLTIIEVVFKW